MRVVVVVAGFSGRLFDPNILQRRASLIQQAHRTLPTVLFVGDPEDHDVDAFLQRLVEVEDIRGDGDVSPIQLKGEHGGCSMGGKRNFHKAELRSVRHRLRRSRRLSNPMTCFRLLTYFRPIRRFGQTVLDFSDGNEGLIPCDPCAPWSNTRRLLLP